MKRAVLLALAATATLLPAVSGTAWVNEYSGSTCSAQTDNIGGLPSDGTCASYCPSGNCWGSQRVTCSSNEVVFERFAGAGCTGSPILHANYTGTPSNTQCLETMYGGNSFKIFCDEQTTDHSNRYVNTFYSDDTCNTPIYGPVYSLLDVDVCNVLSGGTQSRAQYCEAGGAGVHDYQFGGSSCAADSWTAITYTPAGSAAGSCQATFSDGATRYSRVTCPGSASTRPPYSFPPDQSQFTSSPGFRCADSGCKQQCTQRVANRLGLCSAFDTDGVNFQRQVCSAPGGNKGIALTTDSACAGQSFYTALNPVGASVCDASTGEYNVCPSAASAGGTTLSAAATLPSFQGIWRVEYSDSTCSTYNHATHVLENACQFGQLWWNVTRAGDAGATAETADTVQQFIKTGARGCRDDLSPPTDPNDYYGRTNIFPLNSCQAAPAGSSFQSFKFSDDSYMKSFTLPDLPVPQPPAVSSSSSSSSTAAGAPSSSAGAEAAPSSTGTNTDSSAVISSSAPASQAAAVSSSGSALAPVSDQSTSSAGAGAAVATSSSGAGSPNNGQRDSASSAHARATSVSLLLLAALCAAASTILNA